MSNSNQQTKVSIIIAAYNQAKLLQLAVESVLAQTYSAIELIVVDDGSVDDTPQVMLPYLNRITYIRQENQGANAATKTGIHAASGGYIGFLDHDDLFEPTKIERQVQLLDSNADIDFVHCGYYHIDPQGNYLDKTAYLPDGNIKDLILGNFIWSGAPLMRRKCLQNIDVLDEEGWTGDTDWWLYLAQSGYRFACIQEPLGAHRIMPGSMMSHLDKVEQGAIAVLDRVYSDPDLPADVQAIKNLAYGNTYFWISCRYYAAGQWIDAQRAMAQAMALRPNLLENPSDFFQHLLQESLGARLRGEPIAFAESVFDHLPPEAQHLQAHRSYFLGKVYIGVALRNYASDKIDKAQQLLIEGIRLSSSLLDQPNEFADLLVYYADRLPVNDPFDYVEKVFRHLPANTRQLGRARSRVIADLNIAHAFLDYSAGREKLVPGRILQGLRHRPMWLTNRGVVSIFFKSFIGKSADMRR